MKKYFLYKQKIAVLVFYVCCLRIGALSFIVVRQRFRHPFIQIFYPRIMRWVR